MCFIFLSIISLVNDVLFSLRISRLTLLQLSSFGHLQKSKQGTESACSFSLQLSSLADINTFSLELINFYLLHLSLMRISGLEPLNRPCPSITTSSG
jgi:hypothetical protein